MSNLFDPGFRSEFKRETWALYAVGILAVILRLTARVKRLRFSGLQADDYVMLFAVVWYTILCVGINQVTSGGGSNLMTSEDVQSLTREKHAERVRGSKWVFVSEHAMVLTLWSAKACMLLIYARITSGLSQRRLVNYLAIYTALSFVATELSLFLICRPFSDYFAVPTSNYQCSSYQHYEIVEGCLSIVGDSMMLLIAIPLVLSIRLPLRQKLTLLFLFGLGIFVIVAAILTKVYCLVPRLISYVYLNWYFREATVAMLVTNLPLTWSLLRDIFPAFKSWTGGSKPYHRTPYVTSGRTGSRPGFRASKAYRMQSFNALGSLDPKSTKSSHTASQEYTNASDEDSQRSLHIRQDVTITVQSADNESRQHLTGSPEQQMGQMVSHGLQAQIAPFVDEEQQRETAARNSPSPPNQESWSPGTETNVEAGRASR